MAWRYNPIANLCVHPSKLRTGLTGVEQPSRIKLNTEAGSANMPVDYVPENLVELLLNEGHITRVCKVRTNSFEEPQGGIDRIELRSVPKVWKTVWKHALVNVLSKCAQNAASDFVTSGRKRKTREGDHCVTSPIAEPVIAGNNAVLIAAGDDVLVGSGCECSYEFVPNW